MTIWIVFITARLTIARITDGLSRSCLDAARMPTAARPNRPPAHSPNRPAGSRNATTLSRLPFDTSNTIPIMLTATASHPSGRSDSPRKTSENSATWTTSVLEYTVPIA